MQGELKGKVTNMIKRQVPYLVVSDFSDYTVVKRALLDYKDVFEKKWLKSKSYLPEHDELEYVIEQIDVMIEGMEYVHKCRKQQRYSEKGLYDE